MPAELTTLPGGATTDELIELPFSEKTITIAKKKFKFRELSVEENDQCADTARNQDGTINGRAMMRLMIIYSSVEPKLTAEILGKMPQRAYIQIYDAVNDLNTIDFSDDEEEAGKN